MSFISSLAQNQTKCLFLNDDPCMVSLNKCTGSCNDLSPKICVPKKAKDINVNKQRWSEGNEIVMHIWL